MYVLPFSPRNLLLVLENCWTFVLKNPTIRLDSETITCPALKIVATDDEKVNAKDEEK